MNTAERVALVQRDGAAANTAPPKRARANLLWGIRGRRGRAWIAIAAVGISAAMAGSAMISPFPRTWQGSPAGATPVAALPTHGMSEARTREGSTASLELPPSTASPLRGDSELNSLSGLSPVPLAVDSATPPVMSLEILAPVASRAAHDSGAPFDAISEQFRGDLRAFAADLLGTGRMNAARAQRLSVVAVTESYRRRLPPALVLGVMLVENGAFDSFAASSAGAHGLMQVLEIHAPIAVLRDDSRNISIGTSILADMARRARFDLTRTLLLYNGCVTNRTPCVQYPTWVRHQVERHARSLCPSRSFTHCVEQPFAHSSAFAPDRILATNTSRALDHDIRSIR